MKLTSSRIRAWLFVAPALASLLVGACATHAEPVVAPPTTSVPPISPMRVEADASAKQGELALRASWPAAVQKLADTAKSAPHAEEIARSLSDEVGPRSTGSPGDPLAIAWAKRTMGTVGLEHVTAEPVKVMPWQRGVETAQLTAPFSQSLHVTALGGSVATPPQGIVADVLEVPSLAALEKLDRSAVAGKIVFVDAPTRKSREGSGYDEAVGARFVGARKAEERGALAFLVRSIGTARDRFPHTGAKAKDDHEIPAAALSVSDAELLHRVIAETGSAKVHLTLGPRALPQATSANVIGEIPAKSQDAETVLLAAHLDSWDLGTGALDDASGCGIVLEAARLLRSLGEPSRRTVRVVLFANEEHGGDGAKTYAAAHASEADKMAVAIEADSGGDVVFGARYLGAKEASASFDKAVALLAPLGVARIDEDAEGGSDVRPLRKLGVPIVDLGQDESSYFDVHHSANDTADKIDPDRIEQAALAFAITAWWAANVETPLPLGRVPEGKRPGKW